MVWCRFFLDQYFKRKFALLVVTHNSVCEEEKYYEAMLWTITLDAGGACNYTCLGIIANEMNFTCLWPCKLHCNGYSKFNSSSSALIIFEWIYVDH